MALVVISVMIVEFAMLIWGTVLVFGSWSNWKEDWDAAYYDRDDNYCPFSPMMMAFVLLILKWVSIGETSSGLISRVYPQVMIPVFCILRCFDCNETLIACSNEYWWNPIPRMIGS